jgi:hypothetical protein
MARSLRTLTVLTTAALALSVIPAPATAQPDPPWAPPEVVEVTAVSARLTWTSPTTDPEVSYYRIYRVTTRNGQPYDQFYNASYTTSLLLALLEPDTEYTFFVETGDHTSNGLRSERVTFRTPPAPDDSEPPSPPGTPRASSVTPGSLTLSWEPSTDNDGVVAYYVYRTLPDGQVKQAAAVVAIGNDQPSWTFARLLPDLDYEYHVVARDAAGNRSAPSESLRLRTPADPATSCQASYTAIDVGASQFEGTITIDNTGGFADVWTLRFALPGGQQVQFLGMSGWVQTGTDVVSWYDGWAGGLSQGLNLVTFYATHTGSNPPPTAVTVNGQACPGI